MPVPETKKRQRSRKYLSGHNFRPGVTLVDMVVAVLILSIVSAVTVPRMAETLDRYKLRSAATVLASHLDYLRRQAIIRGQDLTVQLGDQPPILRCSQIAMPNQPGSRFELNLADEFQISAISLDGVEGDEIRFDRHGYSFDSQGAIDNWSVILNSPSADNRFVVSQTGTEFTVSSHE